MGGGDMAKCKDCEGWGSRRDPKARDGWARDADGNAVPCTTCNQSGEVEKADKSPDLADAGDVAEQRGA